MRLIPVMLAKCLEGYPLYANRGFILHVHLRNFGNGQLTWIKGFKRNRVNAAVTANNQVHTMCYTHVARQGSFI